MKLAVGGALKLVGATWLALLVTGPLAVAGGRGLRASDVNRMIDTDGAQAALARLVSDQKSEDLLFDGIATGEKGWIRIAERLRAFSDGHVGEGLVMAIQEALPKNPKAVLKLVQKGAFTSGDVCGEYGFGQIEDERPKEVILGLIDLRVGVVTAINSSSLVVERKACLQELAKLRKVVALR